MGISRIDWIKFLTTNALAYKTIVIQIMLEKGFLASNSFYGCIEHIPENFSLLDPIFCLIRQCEEGWDIKSLLHSPVSHSEFKRLN